MRSTEFGARSGCPINAGLEALGDQLSLLVLRDIIFGGRRQFRELLIGSQEHIASNILSSRLKRLVDAGLLTRSPSTRGQRGSYSLTEAGIQTLPIMVALGNWGLDFREGTPALRLRAAILRDSDPSFIAELMDELRAIHLDGAAATAAGAWSMLTSIYHQALAELEADAAAKPA